MVAGARTVGEPTMQPGRMAKPSIGEQIASTRNVEWRRSRINRAAHDVPPRWPWFGRCARECRWKLGHPGQRGGGRHTHVAKRGGRASGALINQRNDRRLPPRGQQCKKIPSDLRFWSPRRDSNPRPSDYETDARRRPGRRQTDRACSRWLRCRSRRLPTDTEGYRRIVWMIIGMIKAHPTQNRMARQLASLRLVIAGVRGVTWPRRGVRGARAAAPRPESWLLGYWPGAG